MATPNQVQENKPANAVVVTTASGQQVYRQVTGPNDYKDTPVGGGTSTSGSSGGGGSTIGPNPDLIGNPSNYNLVTTASGQKVYRVTIPESQGGGYKDISPSQYTSLVQNQPKPIAVEKPISNYSIVYTPDQQIVARVTIPEFQGGGYKDFFIQSQHAFDESNAIQNLQNQLASGQTQTPIPIQKLLNPIVEHPELLDYPSRDFYLNSVLGLKEVQQSIPKLQVPFANLESQFAVKTPFHVPTEFEKLLDQPPLTVQEMKNLGTYVPGVSELSLITTGAVVGSAKGIYNLGQTGLEFIKHPIDTTVGIGKNIYDVGYDIGTSFTKAVNGYGPFTREEARTPFLFDIKQQFVSNPYYASGFVPGEYILGPEIVFKGITGFKVNVVSPIKDVLYPYARTVEESLFKEVNRGLVEGATTKITLPELNLEAGGKALSGVPGYLASLFEEPKGTGVVSQAVKDFVGEQSPKGSIEYLFSETPGKGVIISDIQASIKDLLSEPPGQGIVTKTVDEFSTNISNALNDLASSPKSNFGNFNLFNDVKQTIDYYLSEPKGQGVLSKDLQDTYNYYFSEPPGQAVTSKYFNYLFESPKGTGVFESELNYYLEDYVNKDLLKLKDIPAQIITPTEQYSFLSGSDRVLIHASPSRLPFAYNPITGEAKFEIVFQEGRANVGTARYFSKGLERGLFFGPSEGLSDIAQAYTYYIRPGGFSDVLGGSAKIGFKFNLGKPTLTIFNEVIEPLPESALKRIKLLEEGKLNLKDISPEFVAKAREVLPKLNRKPSLESLSLYFELEKDLNKAGKVYPGIAGLTGIRNEYEASLSLGSKAKFEVTTLRGKIGKITGLNLGDYYIRELNTGRKIEVYNARVIRDSLSKGSDNVGSSVIQDLDKIFTGRYESSSYDIPEYNLASNLQKGVLVASVGSRRSSKGSVYSELEVSSAKDLSKGVNSLGSGKSSDISFDISFSGKSSGGSFFDEIFSPPKSPGPRNPKPSSPDNSFGFSVEDLKPSPGKSGGGSVLDLSRNIIFVNGYEVRQGELKPPKKLKQPKPVKLPKPNNKLIEDYSVDPISRTLTQLLFKRETEPKRSQRIKLFKSNPAVGLVPTKELLSKRGRSLLDRLLYS